MKIITITQSITLFALIVSSTANARQIEIIKSVLGDLPSSPIVNIQTNELLSCKTDSNIFSQTMTRQSHNNKKTDFLPKSLEYLNDAVKTTYNTMRNGVINHVTIQVALSLLNFNVDGFTAENIASYVSDGTKP